MELRISDPTANISVAERAAIEAITSGELRPCPRYAEYFSTVSRTPDNQFLGLLRTEWPTGILGSGFNLVLVSTRETASRVEEIHKTLSRDPVVNRYVPVFRCRGNLETISSILFSDPDDHPESRRALASPRLITLLLEHPIHIGKLRSILASLIQNLQSWQQSGVVELTKVSSFFEGMLPIENAPVPSTVSALDFNMPGIPILPNPIKYFFQLSDNRSQVIEAVIGRINGEFSPDNIIVASPPILLNWQKTRVKAPLLLDMARLELEMLLNMLPPEDPRIWKDEWPVIGTCLLNPNVSILEVRGLAAPTVWELIKTFRSLIGLDSQQRLNEYALAAVRAGLDLAVNNVMHGARRFAAIFYSALALAQVQSSRDGSFFLEGATSSVFWPGFYAWIRKPVNTHARGRALLIGAGTFELDGSIDQLPQVKTDLRELARFLAGQGYEVHILIDQDFTRGQFERKLASLTESTAGNSEPLIVCFCGHGVRQGGGYYLVTGDSTRNTFSTASLEIEEFMTSIVKLKMPRVLILLNSCYSGQYLSIPLDLTRPVDGSYVLLASASNEEQSYMLRDDPLSIFIETVLEALSFLTGNEDRHARIFEFLNYVSEQVPLRASRIGKPQTPRFLLMNVRENFPLL